MCNIVHQPRPVNGQWKGFYFWTLGKVRQQQGGGVVGVGMEVDRGGLLENKKVDQSVQTSHAKSNYMDQRGGSCQRRG